MTETESKNLVNPVFQPQYFFIRCESRIVKIRYDEVLYIEGMSEYVRVVTKNRPKPLMPLLSMKRMLDILPPHLFMRVHRSYIVNLEAIDEVQRMHVIIGQESIPISDMYKDDFFNYIDSHLAGAI